MLIVFIRMVSMIAVDTLHDRPLSIGQGRRPSLPQKLQYHAQPPLNSLLTMHRQAWRSRALALLYIQETFVRGRQTAKVAMRLRLPSYQHRLLFLGSTRFLQRRFPLKILLITHSIIHSATTLFQSRAPEQSLSHRRPRSRSCHPLVH